MSGPNETFSMVFYLDITELQYNSQSAKLPMGPKHPGPTVVTNLFLVLSPLCRWRANQMRYLDATVTILADKPRES